MLDPNSLRDGLDKVGGAWLSLEIKGTSVVHLDAISSTMIGYLDPRGL